MAEFSYVNMTELNPLEITGLLASKNLSVGTWKDQKGNMHISITRMGRYNKNIAIPLDAIPALLDAIGFKYEELT